jgi:AcrR family transcriptional regulator
MEANEPARDLAPRATAIRPGRRERRKRITRRDLLLAGRRLFADRGLYAARVEDLTRRAGIAKGTLYRYYPGKEALIVAVVDAGFGELRACVSEATEGARTLPAVVRRIVAAHLGYFSENPDMMKILHQVRGLLTFEPGARRPLRACLRGHLDWLAGRLARGGVRLGPARRRGLAALLFGALSGVASVREAVAPGAVLRPAPRSIVAALCSAGLRYAAGGSRAGRRGGAR